MRVSGTLMRQRPIETHLMPVRASYRREISERIANMWHVIVNGCLGLGLIVGFGVVFLALLYGAANPDEWTEWDYLLALDMMDMDDEEGY